MSNLLRLAFSMWFVGVSLMAAAPEPLDLNRIPPLGWQRGATVSVIGGIPPRTNVTVINASQAPYNADKTGNTAAHTAINNAIAAASSNTVVYLEDGIYKVTSFINLNKSGVTLRGQSYGGVTIYATNGSSSQTIKMGAPEASPYEHIPLYSGATRGSTNLVLAAATAALVGDIVTINQRNSTNELWQQISTTGYTNLLGQTCRVTDKSGTNVTVWPPLLIDYTNQATMTLRSRSFAGFVPIQMSGVENIIFSNTNNGASGSATFIARSASTINCWWYNCKFISAANYNLQVTDGVNMYVGGCTFEGRTGPAVSNHGGLLVSYCGGMLVENSAFHKSLFPGIEFNEFWSGNYVATCLFTNVHLDILCHNTHPLMNGFEGNRGFALEFDGYFGSSSHFTLYRNWFASWFIPLLYKRFNSYHQTVGNLLGTNGATYLGFSVEVNGSGAQIAEMGYPNIGNGSYSNSTPTVSWNWPGNYRDGGGTNGYTFPSAQGPTTTLNGDFSFINSTLFTLWNQKASNTNYYVGADNGGLLSPNFAGTSVSVELNRNITVDSGDTLYMVGSPAWQQLQSSNKLTHLFNANYDYYNNAQTFNGAYSSTLYSSLLYSNTPPTWWYRTNTINPAYFVSRYPAIQPESTPTFALIPPEIWFHDGTNPFTQGDTPTPPSQVMNLTVTGRVSMTGQTTLQ